MILALPLGLAACPQFLSDGFQIGSGDDASVITEPDSSAQHLDGGPGLDADATIEAVAPEDVGLGDATPESSTESTTSDSPEETDSAANDAPEEMDAPSEAGDIEVEQMNDAAGDGDAGPWVDSPSPQDGPSQDTGEEPDVEEAGDAAEDADVPDEFDEGDGPEGSAPSTESGSPDGDDSDP